MGFLARASFLHLENGIKHLLIRQNINPSPSLDLSDGNPWFSPNFSKYIKYKLVPTYPLWSQFLIGDLSRFIERYISSDIKHSSVFNSVEMDGSSDTLD